MVLGQVMPSNIFATEMCASQSRFENDRLYPRLIILYKLNKVVVQLLTDDSKVK
jgi:hypothetical protein